MLRLVCMTFYYPQMGSYNISVALEVTSLGKEKTIIKDVTVILLILAVFVLQIVFLTSDHNAFFITKCN